MTTGTVKFAASLLAADFGRLGEQVVEAERAGVDRIHADVMDGRFVPNLTGGLPGLAWLRRVSRLPVETHLMVSDPTLLLDSFIDAGSDAVLVHWESCGDLSRTVLRIKQRGKRAGVVINPATPASLLEEILPELDRVLVMTVSPGFGQQSFMHSTLPKIRRVRTMIDDVNPTCDLAVDGGINATTAALAVDAGANVLVAGSAIFGDRDGVAAALKRLRAAVRRADASPAMS